MSNQGSLTIVGSGIKFMSHLTTEAKAAIEHADCVLYLVNEPAMREWLHVTNANCESLENAYAEHSARIDTYHAITKTILANVQEDKNVCVVLEGHPTVFATPALNAVIEAKKRGIPAFVLPGISAEDYLFAELQIDPGSVGCQSYEATDFLIHNRAFDGYSHLILWQVSVIGLLKNNAAHDNHTGATVLVEHLQKCYPLTHEVILFEGSQYPHIESTIKKIVLVNLPNTDISRITTLYLPPVGRKVIDVGMMKKLGISQNRLDITHAG